MNFARIDYKNYIVEILDIIVVRINEAMVRLKEGKLVGMKYVYGNVKVSAIPKILRRLKVVEGCL